MSDRTKSIGEPSGMGGANVERTGEYVDKEEDGIWGEEDDRNEVLCGVVGDEGKCCCCCGK